MKTLLDRVPPAWMDWAGYGCVLALPLALLHARAVAEMLIAGADVAFLLRAWRAGDWGWARERFAAAALVWWAVQAAASVLAMADVGLALAAVRFPLLAVATAASLRGGVGRARVVWWVIAAAFVWIAVECWQQALFGSNLFGQPRWSDGALTGPFNKPRAGPALILVFFPVVVPAVSALLARPLVWARGAALLVAACSAATVVLVGQRMPTLLLAIGMALSALFVRGLRVAFAAAVLAGGAVLAAAPYATPAMYEKLVTHTEAQLGDFAHSAYGEIWVRAAVLAEQRPWTGWGFDGFRRHCNDRAAVRGLPVLGVTQADADSATDACNIHPHNYYLEAANNGGLPLLAAFVAMVAAALWRVWAAGSTGVLIGAIVAFWPIASTSGFHTLPNAGWVFLLLGLGFSGLPPAGKGFALASHWGRGPQTPIYGLGG
jgi:O-antigen ligase